MQAEAIVCHEDRRFELRDVQFPDPGPDDVVVRTRYSGVSMGTERNLATGNVSWGPFPIVTGYQGVGVIETVGANVDTFAVGDEVYYRDNGSMALTDGTGLTAASGTHCSRVVVDPDDSHGFARLPEGAEPKPASLFVMPAVGLNGVDMAAVGMGDVVAVQGVGLIGLGVVAACHQRGAEVIAIDLDADRLATSKSIGADHTVNATTRDPVEVIGELTDDGVDVAFEATGVPDMIDAAMEFPRTHGTFVFQGDYGDRDISFYFREPHGKRLTTHFPCDDGQEPCRDAVLRQMASGALPWQRTITHEFTPDEALDFYARLVEEQVGDVLGAVIEWNTDE